jgi:hypothetical protein
MDHAHQNEVNEQPDSRWKRALVGLPTSATVLKVKLNEAPH